MIRLPTAVVGIAALVAVAAHAQPNNPNANKNPDQSFVDQAAAGGIAEVDAAKLALQKSHNAKVRRFAQRMVSDHAKANESSMSWLRKKALVLAFHGA
jgi:predicted outer membrane protein